jgi:ABC-type phosphate transport system substrate-binding protein
MIFIVIAPQLGVCGRCRIRKLTARVRTGIAVCDQLYELETGALFHERRLLLFVLRDAARQAAAEQLRVVRRGYIIIVLLTDSSAPVIRIDGSSTVVPIAEGVAEEFQRGQRGRVTVGLSGTPARFLEAAAAAHRELIATG